MTRFLYRLGRGAVRRRRLVVLGWIIIAVGIMAVGRAAGGATSDTFEIPGVEAQRAADTLEQRFPAVAGTSAQLVFAVDDGTLSDAAASRAVDVALADVARQPDVVAVSELNRSPDNRIAYADVQYARPSSDMKDDAFKRL